MARRVDLANFDASLSQPFLCRRIGASLKVASPLRIDEAGLVKATGTVKIKAIARDAGNRTKIAVASNDPNVDAVGACVGLKGSRVRAVVEELNGEKIDVIRWNSDPMQLCINALNPADILDIRMNEDMKRIHVQVPQEQLSLAIGKSGQNARLASQLIGWNIDIRGDSESLSQMEGNVPENHKEKEKDGPENELSEKGDGGSETVSDTDTE